MGKAGVILIVSVCLVLATGAGLGEAAGAGSPPMRDHGRGHWFHRACSTPTAAVAQCDAQVVTDASGTPLASPSPPVGAYGPSQFHTGYSLPAVSAATTAPTIAIVDAYDDPNAEADLATYDSYYGLPACTTANGCFKKVNQSGGTNYPARNAGWALEISLDIETAHEICQNCRILLVEASSSSLVNLGVAENEAATLDADAISNSWGASEYSTETSDDNTYFDHPGIAITASSGDAGYGVEYPAASKYVTAAGGTTLNLNADNSYKGESAWVDGGSGCSVYESKPSWQTDSGCSRRTVVDVAADADPNTGAAVYDSVPSSGQSGWLQVGGTSLSSPLLAAVYALAGNTGSINNGSALYANAGTSSLHDVTTGSNGSCSPAYLCTAGAGYDGPTGVGSPNGTGAFSPSGGNPPVNTVVPVVSGSTVSGQVLSVSNGSWTGSPAPAFSYQWQRCDGAGANCVAIGAATGQTYTLAAADVGHTMVATVTGENASGTVAANSAPTGLVAAGGGGGGSGTFGVTSIGTLTDTGGGGYLDLSGPFAIGQAVTVGKLTAYLAGGSSVSKLRGVIYADNGGAPGALIGTSNELSIAAGAAAGWVDLTFPSSLSLPAGSYWLGYWYADANSRHYYVDAAASERYAPAAYSSTNPAPSNFGTASTSTSSYSIYASYITGGTGSPPVNTVVPVVSGSTVSGQVLSVSNGSWTGSPAPAFSYQWQRCDGAGANCVAIGAATGQTYTLAAADVGHTMVATVTGENASGTVAANSAPTGLVAALPSPPVNTVVPVVSGSTVSGQVLSVSNGSWTGSPAPAFSYQWQRCDGAGANCVAIGAATGQTYTLAAADVGHTMVATVTGENASGTVAANSAPTGLVAAGGGGGSGTFGVTSIGTLTDTGGGGYLDLSGPFAIGQAVTVGKLTAYLAGGSSVSKLRGVIYADNGGAPGALIGTSNELSIAAGAAAGWVDLTFPSSLSLPAGSYWLGYWYADANSRHYYVDAAASERYAPAAYSSTNPAPSNFGTASTSTSSYSIYASYTIP